MPHTPAPVAVARLSLWLLIGVMAQFALPATASAQTVTWNQRSTPAPSSRLGHAMVYDSARAVTLLFGGRDGNFIYNAETWEWDGNGTGTWTQRSTSGPSPRLGHAMAYDAAREVTVLFGGFNAGHTLGETWEWNGASWAQRQVSGPSPRFGHAMVYDAARNVTLLFGGNTGGTFSNETWEWNGVSWSLLPVSGPSARYGHAMAYDSTRAVTVLFGGATNIAVGETWEWNGTAWSQRAAAGPSPRQSSMTFDPSRALAILFGGFTGAGARSNETWEWNGNTGTWTRRITTGPSAREEHALAFDTLRNAAVLFGGSTQVGVTNAETWELQSALPCTPPSITTQPTPQIACAGGSATFSAGASGTSPAFQWQAWNPEIPGWDPLTEGPNPGVGVITGAHAPSMTIALPILPPGAAFAIRCIATNPCGTAATSTVALSTNSADFNHDGDTGTDEDIEAFFACLGGTCCPTCGTADFNADGDVGTDADIESFFRVLAGGNC